MNHSSSFFLADGVLGFAVSMPLHLTQKEEYCQNQRPGTVAEYPPEVGEDVGEIPRQHGALQFDRVHKGQGIGNLFEGAADQFEVKPCSRQPGREVGEKRTADAPHLLVGEDASAQQAERNVEHRNRQNEEDGVKDSDGQLQPHQEGGGIADDALCRRNGQHGQGVAQNKIGRGQRCGVEALQE